MSHDLDNPMLHFQFLIICLSVDPYKAKQEVVKAYKERHQNKNPTEFVKWFDSQYTSVKSRT
jgi:hypothetical protein